MGLDRMEVKYPYNPTPTYGPGNKSPIFNKANKDAQIGPTDIDEQKSDTSNSLSSVISSEDVTQLNLGFKCNTEPDIDYNRNSVTPTNKAIDNLMTQDISINLDQKKNKQLLNNMKYNNTFTHIVDKLEKSEIK